MTLPGLILGTVALLLHLALVLLAAPLAGDIPYWRPAQGLPALADALRSPWRALEAGLRRAPVRAANASLVSLLAPLLALAATIAAAALVPSFGTGMLDAPLSDLAAILALLGLGRALVLLAAFDAGLGAAGVEATALAVRTLLAVPAMALSLATLVYVGSTASLDGMLAGFGTSGLSGTVALSAASLGLAAVSAGGDPRALDVELSGPDLALFRYRAALERLVWLDLVTGLLLPAWLPALQSNPLWWLLGLLGWVVRTGGALLLLGLARHLLGAPDAGTRRRLAGTALLLGVLAPLLLLAGGSAA